VKFKKKEPNKTMEEENTTRIKKIITTIDDEKSYSIDVDETTTFYEFKKILAAAAHLLKNCFRIYHEQQEYTNDYDDNTIQEMFADLDPIPLRIVSNKDVYEFEDELISVRFNINVPCQIHIGKYKMMYCFTCNKSICMDCMAEDHRNHQVEEKADYLAPAQLLMNNIFSNSALYRADTRLSKYMECVNFRSNLKLNIFDNLRKMINDLEIKFASCLEYFSTCEDETEKNTNENLELLKKYCIECFIKLKNDINTKGIIIDDEIFLTLYRKLKEIEKYKTQYFEENKFKYEKLNTLLAPFIQQVEQISEELKVTFTDLLSKDLYDNFKNLVQENIVEKVQKETVNDFMFQNLGVPRKSLNRMSLGNLSAYKKKGKNYISPNKIIKEERSPFQRANLSEQRDINNSSNIFGQKSLSKTKNTQQGNITSSMTWNKTEEQNNRAKGLNILSQTNNISSNNISNTFDNRMLTTNNISSNNISNTFGNRIVTTTTTTTYTTQGQNVITNEVTKTTNSNNTNTSMFGGKLVDVLSHAINKKEYDPNHFLFIAPIYNTNTIIGAFPDENTARINIDFKKVFNEKDLQLNSFPQGGAFCNDEKYSYFSGGQEKPKGVGKIFLRMNTNIENGKIEMTKMPSMLYSHYNHSMISNDNYIFVIGGNNSNKCEAFNIRTSKWEAMPDLNSPERQRAILAIYDNYLYAFMGCTQYGILDTVERIYIKDLKKWEKVNVKNPSNINIKFYGAGVYCLNGELFFVAGKKGTGNNDDDYKKEICSFKFDTCEFLTDGIYFNENLEFIENQFHHLNDSNIGNFMNGEGALASLPLSELLKLNMNN